MSMPSSSKCVANECRRVWQCASFRPARFAADETIFCKFLVESFPLRLVNKNSWPSCFFAWA